jgi:Zn-dependent M28 family amino/carboxypeptidase
MDGTYNPGALDNASGVAAMLEIARILTLGAGPPPKSVVFIAFNGEEQEMQGSAHYARNPCYPLDGAVMINIDCVGASEPGPLMINEFSAMMTQMAHDLYELSGRLGIEAEMGSSSASDHAHFALAGIEAIDLTDSGFYSVYHGPFDTLDQIDIGRVVQAVRLVAVYVCMH